MKFIRSSAMTGGLLLACLLSTKAKAVAVVQAPAPGSIAGTAIAAQVSSGTGTLGTNGYYLLLPANSGSNYSLIGITSGTNSSGTYSYSASGSIGSIAFNDSIIGSGTDALAFQSSSNGQFSLAASTNTQNGNFIFAAGTAPASLAGHSYFLNIADGRVPFANSGSVIFTTQQDGSNYTVMSMTSGVEGSHGTYTYGVTNTATSYFCIEDALSGNSTEYFAYTSTNAGVYLVTQQYPGGGFQVGNFTVSNLIPAMFFMGQTDVTSEIDYLQFTNGTAFGYYNVMDFPFPIFYHYDLGFEYFFDAHNSDNGAYLYDFSSSTFFYTSPSLFPYLYDFKLNAWLYYFPDPNHAGHYSSNPRWFYNFATSQFINK